MAWALYHFGEQLEACYDGIIVVFADVEFVLHLVVFEVGFEHLQGELDEIDRVSGRLLLPEPVLILVIVVLAQELQVAERIGDIVEFADGLVAELNFLEGLVDGFVDARWLVLLVDLFLHLLFEDLEKHLRVGVHDEILVEGILHFLVALNV
jgi:hypothetical protein